MTIPDDESQPRPAGPTGAGEPTTPPPAPEPTAPAAGQGFPAAPPPPPPAYPAGGAAPAGAPVVAPSEPPRTVNIAFWLYVVGAVLSVVSGIITLATIGAQRDQALEAVRSNSDQLNGQNAQTVVDAIIAGATVWAIITLIFWAVTFVLFAYFMRRGANWARIVLTVLTALSLLNILAGYGVGFLQFAATVVAVVLMWLRPSNAYFAAVRASKAPRA